MQLRQHDDALRFLFLDGSYELIVRRMAQRAHFFSPDMLRSQFDTLERPEPHEAYAVNIDDAFEAVVDRCVAAVRAGC